MKQYFVLPETSVDVRINKAIRKIKYLSQKAQERIEKLENEVRELRAEIIAIKTTPKINPDIYPWQQPQVRFTPFQNKGD